MEYCSLMSGSWGNCHYIRAGATSILIDAGQSGKQILANMAMAGCGQAEALSAIVVTHAHGDHASGVGILARKLKLPVYATEGAWFEMGAMVGHIPDEQRHIFGCDDTWAVGDLRLEAFPTSHDALESVGFVLRQGEQSLGIATDCGVFTSRMEKALQNIQALVLEANHDPDMLRTGKYPAYLKKRIAGIEGHLSNEDAGAALRKVAGGNTRQVMLAHLSQENNTKEKALASVSQAVRDAGLAAGLALAVAPRCTPGAWIDLGDRA